jgi:branched-chain amino acid transport system substrate-binding protein
MNSPEKTANAFRDLCNSQHASILMGVPSIKCSQVAKHVANLYGKPFISLAFDEKIIDNVDNVLLFNQNPYSVGRLTGLYFFYVLKKNKLAILYDDSVSSFLSIAKGFEDIKKVGASVALEPFNGSTSSVDLSAHLGRLKVVNPEVIFILSDSTLYDKTLKIAKDALSINAIFALNDIPDSEYLSNSIFDNVYVVLPFFEKKEKFVNSTFYKNYSQEFGTEPDLYSALGYDEMVFLYEILYNNKSISFDKNLVSSLRSTKFKKDEFNTSFMGFDEKGLSMKPIDILKISNGNIIYSGEFWMDNGSL